MRHCLRNIVTTVFLIAMASTAFAEVVTIDVTVKAIDAKERSITVTKTTKSKSKDIELEVGKTAKILVGGKEASLDAVKVGQKVSVSYETELEVVTKIDVAGDGDDLSPNRPNWKFWDVFDKGTKLDQAFVVSPDGVLISSGQGKGVCLASIEEFSAMTLTLDFQFKHEDASGNSFVSVASTLPNPKAKDDWIKQMPFGIEVKLNSKGERGPAGKIVLPPGDFSVRLIGGQKRDQQDKRKIYPIRPAKVEVGKWNALEVICGDDQNITVKINGVVINQLADVQSTKGHVVIWLGDSGLQLRNATVKHGDKDVKLSFEKIE